MNHEDMFENPALRRIPMAPAIAALRIAMSHPPTHYVVSHAVMKLLEKWLLTGKKEPLLLHMNTLQDEVERARKSFLVWEKEPDPPPVKKKGVTIKPKKPKGPLYTYMATRALLCATTVAINGNPEEMVDMLECLDDVPSSYGDSDGEDAESLTSVLESLDMIFHRSHWAKIAKAS